MQHNSIILSRFPPKTVEAFLRTFFGGNELPAARTIKNGFPPLYDSYREVSYRKTSTNPSVGFYNLCFQ